MEITQWQLKLAGGMQSYIHPAYCGLGVAPQNAQKRIKRSGRIRIQQRFAQARLAHHATTDIFFLVPGITKTQFPIPILEVIAKLAHLTAKSGVEEHVSKGSFERSDGCVVNAAEFDPGRHPNPGKRCAIRQSSVRYRERIKCVLDRHADASW